MASNIQPTGLDWKNLPQKTTPISAENLNKMANTIDDLVEAVNPLNTVEANPEGVPTEGLEKVEIDGTLYEVKGGHKILNDSGSTLTQKDNLQFKGVYTQNNGDNTEVDIVRTMTKAQMEALSGEELKGFINTSDEPDKLPLTAEWVAYDDNTSVKDKIDSDNAKTNVAVTSLVSGVTVDINKSCKIGNTLYLIVKGHYTGTLSNTTCLGVDIPSLSVANYTFPVGLGQEWNINGIGYGYIDSNKRITMSASVTNGYFHICQALPLA